MTPPPYHLRPNKAIDRLTFFEGIRRLEKLGDLSEYTYYGLGGPYLEDFRLIYEFCPQIAMVSIEEHVETYKRQKFNIPCGNLCLKKAQFKSFLSDFDADDQKSIFWLDYTGLEYHHFEEFMVLLDKVAEMSVLKITLRAEPKDYIDKGESFKQKFGMVMPNPSADPPRDFKEYAFLIQNTIRIAAEKAHDSTKKMLFQPLASFYYSDGTGMFTLTGITCNRNEVTKVKKVFQNWLFANLNWSRPKRIDVPILSTKERLHIQNLLPCKENAGSTLREALGYLIDDNKSKSESKLQQYADYHRYFPYFMKAIP